MNKNFEAAYQTTLKVPGLKAEASVEVLTAETSGGLTGSEASGKTYPSTGPKSEKLKLSDGSTIVVPKASIVTVRF